MQFQTVGKLGGSFWSLFIEPRLRTPALLCMNSFFISQAKLCSFIWKPNLFGYDI